MTRSIALISIVSLAAALAACDRRENTPPRPTTGIESSTTNPSSNTSPSVNTNPMPSAPSYGASAILPSSPDANR